MSLPINAALEKKEFFESAFTHFYNNQYFLNAYCAYLLSEQKPEKVLTMATANNIYFNQYEYNLIIGNAYLMNGKLDSSKKYFLQAHYLIPNRFIPLDNLLNMAILSIDKVSAIHYAEKIISIPIKVPSMRVDKIRNDAQLFLTK
jgi:Tfp pilus assembly protein PilF